MTASNEGLPNCKKLHQQKFLTFTRWDTVGEKMDRNHTFNMGKNNTTYEILTVALLQINSLQDFDLVSSHITIDLDKKQSGKTPEYEQQMCKE